MTTAAICAIGEVVGRSSFYRGEQYDPDLGLYYLRARYYNPSTGRFMSRDPLDGDAIDPATLHKYLFANGNPVNLSDPSGKSSVGLTWPGNVASGATGEYAGLTTVVLAISTVVTTVVAAAEVCALFKEASENLAYNEIGLEGNGDEGTIEEVNPCWVQAKFDRCTQMDQDVQLAKTAAAAVGACRPGMSPPELALRIAAWTNLLNSRNKLHEECFNGEPDTGHSMRATLDLGVILICEALLR